MKPRIPDLLNEPWAIVPEKLEMIHAIYQRRLLDEPIDAAALELIETRTAAQAASQDGEEAPPPYELVNGVAVIPVMGVMSRRLNLVSMISGGLSTELLLRDFTAALADPEVLAIVLNVDSPGGAVGGLQALGDTIYNARAAKPVVAFGGDAMASGAYWIGSAASRVMAESTSTVGSIGVVTVHYDYSAADAAAGVKRTYLSAGKYKALGNSAEPLGEVARADIQGRLDYLYSLFVDTVARNRGTDKDTVLAGMADGRQFIGSQALSAGLVDELGTIDDAIAAALSMTETKRPKFFTRG